ncbi:AAA family ATPase [Halorussus salinisoli]|uniref:AAA family ATPase n=1 Tax=Halorussus salinisoli TaxID=2558242 RepID=UPI0010C21B41|nr:AAA family ATPase [Halorussus salinisoli]
MPAQAVKDWISHFQKIAKKVNIDVQITPNEIFHIHADGDSPAVGKVRYSEYVGRKEDHIWQRFNREQERIAENPDEKVFAVQLDVESRDKFNLNHDHFILVTEELLRTELSSNGDVQIDTEDPGSYDAPFDGTVDNWNALFEYIVGETIEDDVRDILNNTPSLESTTETAPYYWVNHNLEEIEGGYLRAPHSDFPNYDLQKLENGDIVFNYTDGKVLGFSEVTKPAYITDVDGEKKRKVDIDVHRFPEPLRFVDIYPYLWQEDVRLEKYYPVNQAGVNQQYLFNLSEEAGEYLLEKGQMKGSNTERLQDRLELPHISISLPEGLYFHDGEEARLRQQINAALNAEKHIIFTGPPGTGKSRIAKEIAEQVIEVESVDDYTFTTATAEWSSFDTIGGYVPSQADSELKFDPRLFLRCFRDEDNTVQNRWLIIDELNRANIDKALGPLFSVLAQDSVELPYEREGRVSVDWVQDDDDKLAEIARNPDRFPVTPAWRLIGTMNTFDKTSLYDLSFAFMRRFSFIHVGVPELTNADGIVSRELLDPETGPNYATVWQRQRSHLKETINDYHAELAVIWSIINDYRSIGPAIILDIFEQIAAFEGGDRDAPLTLAVINFVFPQLEGLRQGDQEDLLEDLAKGGRIKTPSGTKQVELRLDVPYLRQKARDMYDLDIDVHSST